MKNFGPKTFQSPAKTDREADAQGTANHKGTTLIKKKIIHQKHPKGTAIPGARVFVN